MKSSYRDITKYAMTFQNTEEDTEVNKETL